MIFLASINTGKKQRKYHGKARLSMGYKLTEITEIVDIEKSYQRLEKAGLKGNIKTLIIAM